MTDTDRAGSKQPSRQIVDVAMVQADDSEA
jgi:hypothetical protein